MKPPFYILGVLFVLLSFSCKKQKGGDENKIESIAVDFSCLEPIDLRDCSKHNIKRLPLELTDYSLLTYIEHIEFADSAIYIYDKGRVIAFDTEGSFLRTIGRRGNGPGEYTSISSFFIDGENICIYDDRLQTLLAYDKNGGFISSKTTKEPMHSLYPIQHNKYIGKKKYQGDRVETPVLAALNQELSLVSDIKNRCLSSGIGVYDYCSSFNDDVLYWEFLNDTIYSVVENSMLPRYYVDFKKHKIPAAERENKGISEIIEYINSAGADAASGIRYVQEDDSHLHFIFTFKENINYVRYNKETKETAQCYFYDSRKEVKVQYFMKYYQGCIVLSAYNDKAEDSNPSLLFVKPLLPESGSAVLQ